MWPATGCVIGGSGAIESQADPSPNVPTTTKARGVYEPNDVCMHLNQQYQGTSFPSISDANYSNVKVVMNLAAYSPNGNLRTLGPQSSPNDGTAWTNNSSGVNGGVSRWGTRQFTQYSFNGQGGTVIDISFGLGFSTNDVTIEGWINLANTTGVTAIWDFRSGAGDTTNVLIRSNAGKLSLFRNGAVVVEDTNVMSTLTWHHFAWDRDTSAGKSYLYLDGVSVGTPATDTVNMGNPNTTRVGNNFSSANPFAGQIGPVRATVGVSMYPGGTTFTVPVAPFPEY